MTDDNIIDASSLEEMRKRRWIEGVSADLELEPVAGLPVVGTLTDSEKELYVELMVLEADLQDAGKEFFARGAEVTARTIRQVTNPNELFRELQKRDVFESHEEAEQHFRDLSRWNYLRERFWFSLRERLQTYASILSIRAGFTVCRVGWKYAREV